MDFSTSNAGANQPVKVSISARLIPFFAYIIPAFSGALSSLYLVGILQVLGQNETAGLYAISGGLIESTYPVLIALYLAALLGFGVIVMLIVRMVMQTQKASPSSWFFLLGGLLCLAPAVLFLEAESLIIEVLINPQPSIGIATIASNISLLSILSIVSALAAFLIVIVLSVLPFSSRSKPKWSPLIAALLVEILIIGLAIFFQLRLLWLYKLLNL